MLLEKKTIIITGASSGIGKSAATIFSQNGANVVLGARRKEKLEELVTDLNQNGSNAVYLAGDVGEEHYSKRLVDLAMQSFGTLDGAFNNAGIVGDTMPITQMTTENWNTVLETNLTSAYYAAKYQLPILIEKGSGSIVFTSSFVGNANGGLPGMAAYAASKAGLTGLVQSLASDHGIEGVRVNALLPGGTKTTMAGNDPEVHKYINSLHPLNRMASPEEIANVAMFLLSDQASFVSGSNLFADGGVSIKL